MSVRREQFIWNFYKNSKVVIPRCYENVSFNNQKILNKNSTNNTEDVIYVSLFPSFLNSKLVNEEKYIQEKVNHFGFDGAGIILNEPHTTESYLNKFTKRQLRVNIKRALKKIETE